MKLTDPQKTAVQAIADGDVYQQKYGIGAWRIEGANPSVVGRVISMGLASWDAVGIGDRKACTLTTLGIRTHTSTDA